MEYEYFLCPPTGGGRGEGEREVHQNAAINMLNLVSPNRQEIVFHTGDLGLLNSDDGILASLPNSELLKPKICQEKRTTDDWLKSHSDKTLRFFSSPA